MPILSNNRQLWPYLGVLFVTATLVLWAAPVERSLGSGIKSVYVHVALTWTGMTGLIIAGILGLIAAVSKRPLWQDWLNAVGVVGIVFFACGFIASLFSAKINWGAVFWGEPRIQASLKVVIAAGGVLAGVALGGKRLSPVLYPALTFFMLYSIHQAKLVMHPQNPIGQSSSIPIKLTFASLYLLMLAAATLLTLALKSPSIRLFRHRS